MINSVTLIGNLGRDPEVRYTSNGTAVVNLSLAVNEFYTQNDQKQQKTHWIRAVAFQRLAEIIGEYCVKGSKIGIRGQLTSNQWEDNDGKSRTSIEVRVRELELLGNGASKRASESENSSVPEDDEIPF